jgi:HSP20 family protein
MATTAVLEKPKGEPLGRWAPLDLFEGVQDEFARFWTDPWLLLSRHPLHGFLKAPTGWFPRADMYEKNNLLVVRVDLPGIKKEDVHVAVDDGDLVVRGESKSEAEVNKEDYYRLERAAGQFCRRLTLPFDAKAEKIEANFKDGVLEVRIPRPAAEKKPEPQKVQIR